MMQKKGFDKHIHSTEPMNMKSHRFYKDLDKAIENRDKSNVYRLSKLITRYHLFQE